MSRRRPTRAELAAHYAREWLAERDAAQTVPCPTCGVDVDETCQHLDGSGPLDRQPAHYRRIRAAADLAATRRTATGPRPPEPRSSPT
ncbi:hypothetical protein [Pseudonocardia sp. WMMC193]|uniref:zinc finger domain-containing protein n=1 Tax=Pseudonocardia sp. WMMC193 TaxID=2911965 RepID=UPI001F2A7C87|nr:hypothetical protein [Pseudonocardia sp. WMMC193]MCF7550993.1 hypothetical protein [Pseudonocardia sp. WMMC193]